jgi:hypothetical protein
MPEVAIVTLLIAFPLVGVVTRRWITLLFPAFAWPIFYLGLQRGWWGHGVGDGWQYAAALLTGAGVFSTSVAIAAGRIFAAHRRRPA